ncbi:hypothetical protein BFC22_10130 [Carnobacterium divergens]|uniref:LXG domain-containing protein n=1 Tax=Carnobacterium divergens DSM 20623 TaxID=1449336 RepID=A0A0R2HQR5_CARDV|nr:hypothetical protein [Carnobacterium divergens]AOA00450.1 hypothetical protein BFC22_10130 [Carnobacterium divergens]KRN54843.1 hypothetical protein IV74_GL002434 [Carnobacterium divergens DSM 20623]MDO0874329.1 hypothetical protein [Carnobacterium divergens]SUX21454.1 Uncharacterised protein [Carnobacterium divergens]
MEGTGYEFKVDLEELENQREKLKQVFSYVHNGLKNIDEALQGVEDKGIKGKSADSINELMEIIRSDVISVSDSYNNLLISNINVAKVVFKEL